MAYDQQRFTVSDSEVLHIDGFQTFVISASWNKGELIRLCGQKVKGQGHRVTKYNNKKTIFDAHREVDAVLCEVLTI